jgi:hypothetical protein
MNLNLFLKLAGMVAIPFLIVFIPIIAGQRYGMHRSSKFADLQHGAVGSVVGAAFGLLAFMLAFTFQIAANRYDVRKQLLLEEVTHIRTTYLRAGLVPEPFRSDTRKMLKDYVDLRIALAKDPSIVNEALKQSQNILDRFWSFSEQLSDQDRSSESYSLFIASVNDIIDNFNQRVTMTLEYKIPPVVLWILAFVTVLSMLVLGYQFGISGKGSFQISILLTFIFAMVMFLILVLDNPRFSILNQKPMITLKEQLK